MANYELQYMSNLKKIFREGSRELNTRTGIVTLRLPATQIIVDLEEEFPILTSKKVNWEACFDEILWIMQKQSNNTRDLKSKIWDKWADPNGSIGKTYGYQVGRSFVAGGQFFTSQVDYVLSRLAGNPSDRQCVIDLWDPQDLNEMNLPPCVYSSIWSIIDGRLNCMLVQRSADYPVGVPFDTTGYAFLTYLFARHLGVRPGILTHVMADSHIYENQLEGVKQQLENWEKAAHYSASAKLTFTKGAPTNFWRITMDDVSLTGYQNWGSIKYEVAK